MSPLLRTLALLSVALLGVEPARSATPNQPTAAKKLSLTDVLQEVRNLYPPLLAALIEQDIATGRVRQAMGAFDTNLAAGGTTYPSGYYEGRSGFATLDRPFQNWGGNAYAGYRLSSGYLPDYNKDRTGSDGEVVLGFKVPLLREGTIDRRRANLWKSQIDRELADPFILRQHLDFIRAGTIAYFNWLGTGLRLKLAEELLRVARERDDAIATQVKNGAAAPIVQVDNQRLVVSREIGVIQALRRFEAASIELSLFHRDGNAAPILATRAQLPDEFPAHPAPSATSLNSDIQLANENRPEIRRIQLSMKKSVIDLRLAGNDTLPNLDFSAKIGQALSDQLPKNLDRTEAETRLEFRLPLERRDARGRQDVAKAEISRLELDSTFAKNRIAAEVQDSHSALVAAHQALLKTRLNVDLARRLEAAENEKIRQGAADLLALQIREQATFDAQVLEVDALNEYFRAQANYRAATAIDAPKSPPTPTPKR
jgi:outer membrane protein TolC